MRSSGSGSTGSATTVTSNVALAVTLFPSVTVYVSVVAAFTALGVPLSVRLPAAKLNPGSAVPTAASDGPFKV